MSGAVLFINGKRAGKVKSFSYGPAVDAPSVSAVAFRSTVTTRVEVSATIAGDAGRKLVAWVYRAARRIRCEEGRRLDAEIRAGRLPRSRRHEHALTMLGSKRMTRRELVVFCRLARRALRNSQRGN